MSGLINENAGENERGARDECRDYQRGACLRGQRCKYLHVGDVKKQDSREVFVDSLLMKVLGGLATKHSFQYSTGKVSSFADGGVSIEAADKFPNTGRKRTWRESAEEIKKRKLDVNDREDRIAHAKTNTTLTPSKSPDDFLRNEYPSLPICKDFLKGRCARSICCKYRHLSLDEFETETFERATMNVIKRLVALIGQ